MVWDTATTFVDVVNTANRICYEIFGLNRIVNMDMEYTKTLKN